jgi:SAM-dependent methyltransferase
MLDEGCGMGANLTWLARYAGAGRVVGIDLVSAALGFCREHRHSDLVQASLTDLPFADRAFDLLTSFDVLGQVPGVAAEQQAAPERGRPSSVRQACDALAGDPGTDCTRGPIVRAVAPIALDGAREPHPE